MQERHETMDSLDQTRRQLRFALFAVAVLFPVGVIGYMVFERLPFLDAVWITIITLGTIGYGDLVPTTDAGRIFTIFLIFFGLGAVALVAQASIEFLASPHIRALRTRRRAEVRIQSLTGHFIICGEGELVNRTINYLQHRSELRQENQRQAISDAIDQRLQHWFGAEPNRIQAWTYQYIRRLLVSLKLRVLNAQTLLDMLVIITADADYASALRQRGLLVINDDPTDDRTLRRASITRARALMVMLENDAEALLVVLTARSRSSNLYITVATIQDDIGRKIVRVGANNVLPPLEIAGQFLNNATLRPAVNDYYNSILFDQRASEQIVQLFLGETSSWIDQSLGQLQLRHRFDAGIIGIRMEHGRFYYAPDDNYVFQVGDTVMVVAPGRNIPALQADCCGATSSIPDNPNWQRLPQKHQIRMGGHTYSMTDSTQSIQGMDKHYIICGSGPVLQAALDRLDPERPFVVLSDDQRLITEMQKRGFRIVLGDFSNDDVLLSAGIDRALALMLSEDDRGKAVLTTVTSRALNRNLLIVATAATDDMVPRLRRAGADRIVSPFRIAAQFVLLATLRPTVSDFLQYVLYNFESGIETTELYMQDDSPWIDQRIRDLNLGDLYRAFVIGVRSTTGRFVYAPSEDYRISMGEVLIVITPMRHADTIRLIAHGGHSHRPRSLRQRG